MRLPTEPTLGMMTALVVSSNPEVRTFDLHTALQLVRSTWKSTFKRLEKNNAERIELLPTLPATFAEFSSPHSIQIVRPGCNTGCLASDGRSAGCLAAAR